MKDQGQLHATREDATEIDMPEGFWDDAKIEEPKAKHPVSLRVDPDIWEFFKGQGDGHLIRMHAVLRSYVDAQKKRQRHTPS